MVQIKPPVFQLNIHLPDQQSIVYQPNISNAEGALQRNVNTPLTSYFHVNYLASMSAREPSPPYLRTILYENFLTFFVWSAKDCCWSLRQRGEQIGRMISIHHSAGNGELFYLQTLLKNVLGATSFDYLKTVHGVIQPTFRAACVELELLEDDQLWCKSLE